MKLPKPQAIPSLEDHDSTTNVGHGQTIQIKSVSTSPLENIRLMKGSGQTKMLKRVNAALTRSLDSANELVDMIQHFRTVADHSAEEEITPAASMQDIAAQVLKTLQCTFPMQNVTILKIIPQDLAPIPVAREHLETIFFNLIYYARLEIGDDAGIISIEGSRKKREGAEDTGKRYHDIRISYNSPEIVFKKLPELFDPFDESEDSAKTSRFGLFVAKKLIEHHGGTVRVKATPKSVEFAIEFPA